MLKKFFILFLFFLLNTIVKAQYDTLHYIPPVVYSYFNNQTELIFSTISPTTVTVNVYKSNGNFLFDTTVINNFPVRCIVDNSIPNSELHTNGVIVQGRGLIIRASAPVSVNVRNVARDNFDPNIIGNFSLTSKGDMGLGDSFHNIMYRNTSGVYGIMAVKNNTTITIGTATPQTYLLHAGESILLTSISLGSTLGVQISANNKFVMSSSAHFDSPGGLCHDPIADQLIADDKAGDEFVVIRGYGNSTLEQFTVVATQTNTNFTINNGPTQNIANSGGYLTFQNGVGIGDFKHIVSEKPILIMQGSGISCEGDQAVIPPLKCTGSQSIQTKTFNGMKFEGYVISHPNTVPKLNGVTMANPVVINSTWEYYKFDHTMITPGSDVILTSEGFIHCSIIQDTAAYASFAYFSGFQKNNASEIKFEFSKDAYYLLEGCDNGNLIINRKDATEDQIINITTFGTTTKNVDYNALPNTDTIFVNQYSDTIPITTNYDGIYENYENIVFHIYFTDVCTGKEYVKDTFIVINDYDYMKNIGDTLLNICSENLSTITLNGIIIGGIPDFQYSWLETGSTNNSITIPSSSIKDNDTTFHLTVIDSCMQSQTFPITIIDKCPMVIPNIFTPNNDDKNDMFIIKNLEDYGTISLTILNRWGNVVYENNKYDNTFKGQDNKGNDLVDGVYYYMVKEIVEFTSQLTEKPISVSGYFTIMK